MGLHHPAVLTDGGDATLLLYIILNIARIANAVPVTLYSRVTVNVEIVVLNCQKCNQCLKGHKSRGMAFEGVL